MLAVIPLLGFLIVAAVLGFAPWPAQQTKTAHGANDMSINTVIHVEWPQQGNVQARVICQPFFDAQKALKALEKKHDKPVEEIEKLEIAPIIRTFCENVSHLLGRKWPGKIDERYFSGDQTREIVEMLLTAFFFSGDAVPNQEQIDVDTQGNDSPLIIEILIHLVEASKITKYKFQTTHSGDDGHIPSTYSLRDSLVHWKTPKGKWHLL